MIRRYQEGSWEGVEETQYKNEPGTWMDVSRRVLFSSEESKFESRVFDLKPLGYSSFEMHQHEHCVVVLSGDGTVQLADENYVLSEFDVVHVAPWQPHQFKAGPNGLRILCVVDRERDVPVPIQNAPVPETSQS